MRSKHIKVIYDKLMSAFEKTSSPTSNLSLASLSEPELSRFLFDVITKKIKDMNMQSLTESCGITFSAEESKEEQESKQKQLKKSRQQASLVAGHEQISELKSLFNSTQPIEPIIPKLNTIKDYTQQTISEFITRLLLIVERAGEKEQTTSFYQRLGKYLSDIKKTNEGSAGLYFASLLINPKKILVEGEVLEKVLNMLIIVKPLAFYGWTKEELIIDKAIEHIKITLLEQIQASIKGEIKVTKDNIECGIKILAYIGLARGSIEDLLLVILLLKESHITINFNDILRKVLSLPEIGTGVFSLQGSALEYQIPFERIYIDKNSWIRDKNISITSATDGEYVYFYSPIHGLLLLGVGSDKVKSKIYESKGIIGSKDKVQLLHLNKKLYCWTENKLFRLDINTLEFKESKKMARVGGAGNAKVTASGSVLLIYRETKKEDLEEGESFKVYADVYIHDLGTKAEAQQYSIVHSVGDLRELVFYKNILILTGKKASEAIDLVKNVTIKKEESSLLEHATLCCNPDTNELFIVHLISEAEGFALGKFNLTHLQRQSSPLLASKIAQIKHTFNDIGDQTKQELANLLGIYSEVEEVREDCVMGKVEHLLAALASRANEAEEFINTANERDPNEILKVYKSPLAVHLTVRCLETLFKLIDEFFRDCIEKKEMAMDKLWYVIVILNEHFVAMVKCNISLEDCVGSEIANEYAKLCKTILIPLTGEDLREKYGLSDEELTVAIKVSAKDCIKNSHALGESETEDTFNLLHKSIKDFISTKVMNKNFNGLVSWLAVADNVELLANRIINKSTEAIELLDCYFNIETVYFDYKMKQFFSNSKENIEVAFKLIAPSFFQVIERLFVLIGKTVEKKVIDIQDIIITILPNMLYNHLKNFLLIIKDTFDKHKGWMMENKEELIKKGRLGVEYGRYWKYVKNLLSNEIYLLNCFSVLTTLIMGLQTTPEQLITLSRILLKSADKLKELLASLKEDKVLLEGLKEHFENVEKPIKGSINLEKEYNFIEANIIKIKADIIDIPLPDTNEITVYEMPKNNVITSYTREITNKEVLVKGNHIKIIVKIDYVPNEKNFPYEGYKLTLIPKVSLYVD